MNPMKVRVGIFTIAKMYIVVVLMGCEWDFHDILYAGILMGYYLFLDINGM